MILQFFKTNDFYQKMFHGEIYEIIGKDDVGNFVGLSLDKKVFLLNTADENRVYISKNLQTFLQEIEAYHQCSKKPFPDNPTEEELKEREHHFRALLTKFDPDACYDETTYWSGIVEEMSYGII